MVIYRKYRPQNFNDVIGQENIIKILKGALKRNGVGHAYLFSGPRGTGKTTVARILAKAVNCQNLSDDFEPCGKCALCTEIGEGRSLDFIEIDAASNRGIDEIRQLRDGINFSPAKNKYRVFILDEVHMLTKEAFNALLKTLEEPPAHAIFILATTEIHKVPATIISRCQNFNFTRIPVEKIADLLSEISKAEKIKAERPALDLIARNSDGCVRDAESIFGQIAMMSQGQITLEEAREALGMPDQEALRDFSESLLKKNAPAAIKQIDSIVQSGRDLYVFSGFLVSYLRSMLILKISDELSDLAGRNYSAEDIEDMKKISAEADKNDLAFAVKRIAETQEKMRYVDFPNVYLELAAIEIVLEGIKVDELPNDGKNVTIDSADQIKVGLKNADQTRINDSDVGGENKLAQEELLKLVREKWEEILLKIKERNHSVHAFLKICVPAKISGIELYIAVSYQFYKERLNTTQNRMIVESVISEVAGAKLRVKPFTEKELADMGVSVESSKFKVQSSKAPVEKQEDLLSEALKMFGGQVIAQ